MTQNDRFYFRVKGDAMKDQRIIDGDIVLIGSAYNITTESIVLIEYPDSRLELKRFNDDVGDYRDNIIGCVVELYMHP